MIWRHLLSTHNADWARRGVYARPAMFSVCCVLVLERVLIPAILFCFYFCVHIIPGTYVCVMYQTIRYSPSTYGLGVWPGQGRPALAARRGSEVLRESFEMDGRDTD